MDERQRDCVLAALRYWQWQRHHLIVNERVQSILDIENNTTPLSDNEIDQLCEDLNS